MGRLSDEVRGILRSERQRSGLSQTLLARRAGVSPALVSRIESGRIPATLAQAENLLAVLQRQFVVAAEPLGAELDAELDAIAAVDLADRLAPLLEPRIYHRLAGLFPLVVEGALAALVQGVPVPVDGLDVAVEWDSAEALAEWLRSWGAERWDPRWLEFRPMDVDPRKPLPLRYRIGFVQLRVRMCQRLPAAIDVRVFLHAEGEEAVMRVRPVADVELADPRCARMLRRYRERRAGGDGGGGAKG